jgi:hypothetical protein
MFGFIKKLFGATPVVEKKVEECPVMAAPYKVEAATPVAVKASKDADTQHQHQL